MNQLNSILLEGNVVRDVQAKKTAKGTTLCTFAIASNRTYRTETGSFDKEVSFFDVETWGTLAEVCERNCTKGRGVRVVGRLKQDRWTDSNGKRYSRISVVAEHVEFRPVFQKPEDADREHAAPAEVPDEELSAVQINTVTAEDETEAAEAGPAEAVTEPAIAESAAAETVF